MMAAPLGLGSESNSYDALIVVQAHICIGA
jgi:hypothetical protein